MLNCIIGTAVSGDELFGRRDFVNEMWSSISQGSIILISPRRFGKTSITFDMRDYPRNGYQVYYFDVEALQTPEDLVIEILDKTGHLKTLTTKFKDGLKSILGNVDELGFFQVKVKLKEYLKDDWQNKADQIFEKIFGKKLNVIFILDELPSMMSNVIKFYNQNGSDVAKLLLNWLRQIRITYGIRFIVCGSIGMEQILRKCNAVETINDLKRIILPPLSDDVAKEMIHELLNGFHIKHNDSHIIKIMEEIGIPIPFFIKIFVQAIANEMRNPTELSNEIIKNAYKKRVLGLEGKGYFEHYFTRLKTYYEGDLQNAAKEILDHLAVKDTATKNDLYNIYKKITTKEDKQQFNDLMEQLQDDFYILYMEETSSYRFYTKILKDLWRNKVIGW